jgi:hypothetical protein
MGVPTPLIAGGAPVATIMMYVPLMNIMTFGLCNAKANPLVIAATAAALGTPTPAPCVPAVVAPWSPGSKSTKVAGMAAALKSSKCTCIYGGSITVNQTAGTPHKTS